MRTGIFSRLGSIVPRIIRNVLYSAPTVWALMLPINLVAQQTTSAINSRLLTGSAAKSDATPSNTVMQSPVALPASSANTAVDASSLSSANAYAETPEAAQLPPPDAPDPQKVPDDQRAHQTKRILGVMPNFRAVSTDVNLPAQSVKEKFITASEDSFDYSSIFIPAMLAGYSMATNATPEFHQGAAGYGRYFWHAAVDQTSENYMVEFVVPVMTHEDTRYYTLGKGGFLKRTGYALSRVAITRSDSGSEVFNVSEVVGSGASAGLSRLYYPSRERSFANTGTQWGLDIGIDAAAFIFKEFWPDINHRLFNGNSHFNRSPP